jgi:hypothetical protein
MSSSVPKDLRASSKLFIVTRSRFLAVNKQPYVSDSDFASVAQNQVI